MELATIFTMLVLFQLKHYYVDFIAQTQEMVVSKGIYGDKLGLLHSFQHTIFTFFIVLFVVNPLPALCLAGIDFVAHYHIDWAKVKFGCRDITDKLFWNHLGLDQMLHQITYIILVVLAIK